MKLSIVTVVYNNEEKIRDCLDSVYVQDFDNYEHLIIDGNSSDSTLSIIKSHANEKIQYYSEADDGLYDAMNKGINLARGEYLLFLNSDDRLRDDTCLSRLASISKGVDVLFSGIQYFNGRTDDWLPSDMLLLGLSSLRKGCVPAHPGCLVKREIIPMFNLDYRVASDFKWICEVLSNNCFVAINKNVVVYMDAEGMSAKLMNRLIGLKELLLIYTATFGLLDGVVSLGRRMVYRISARIV
jgi:glycosyltransferase involved in cell wall biosynthesis